MGFIPASTLLYYGAGGAGWDSGIHAWGGVCIACVWSGWDCRVDTPGGHLLLFRRGELRKAKEGLKILT